MKRAVWAMALAVFVTCAWAGSISLAHNGELPPVARISPPPVLREV
ncbi:unnamed protein product, partial [marine sediment metagenome]